MLNDSNLQKIANFLINFDFNIIHLQVQLFSNI